MEKSQDRSLPALFERDRRVTMNVAEDRRHSGYGSSAGAEAVLASQSWVSCAHDDAYRPSNQEARYLIDRGHRGVSAPRATSRPLLGAEGCR